MHPASDDAVLLALGQGGAFLDLLFTELLRLDHVVICGVRIYSRGDCNERNVNTGKSATQDRLLETVFGLRLHLQSLQKILEATEGVWVAISEVDFVFWAGQCN